VVYVIAIPANRYDLLCLEGFARALRVFIGAEQAPVYRALPPLDPAQRLVMHVDPATASVRPFVVCAVLRDVHFDKRRYKSFLDLQEKLHQNICRKRTYVAIGTHDLDTLQPPFFYRALPPQDIRFVPLTEDGDRVFHGKELLDFYREDPSAKHLKPYTDIVYDSPVYPVLFDSADRVLSLPPIINGKHSRIQLHTRNVFIECTGTDSTKANIVLDTVVAMFAEYCAQPFTAEQVEVVYHSPASAPAANRVAESAAAAMPLRREVTPQLSHRQCATKVSEIAGILGLSLPPAEIVRLCEKMQLGPATVSADESVVTVSVPPTRSDVLHPVDVVEDVAIAFGYNRLPMALPQTVTAGAALPLNQFTDLLRAEIARAGYAEMLTHGLCSRAENFAHLLRSPTGPAVSLANPANVEYEVVRTTLLPGALKTLAFNKSVSHKDGIRLFEISDVVLPCSQSDVGCRNERHLVALYSSYSANFEVIHGLADKVMTCVQIQPESAYGSTSLSAEELEDRRRVARSGVVYAVRPCENPTFFAGMAAELVLQWTDSEGAATREVVVGSMGVVHPTVLQNFDISYPCTVLELNLELLM
jgi:phenylalanyl-tRNA synthetase beta chain